MDLDETIRDGPECFAILGAAFRAAGESPPAFEARVAADLALDRMTHDPPEVLAAMPVGTRRLWPKRARLASMAT